MNDQFYDIVDSEGNVVETAEQQRQEALQIYAETKEQLEANSAIVELPKEIPLVREQPKLTEGEIKKLRKQHVTVQHPRVNPCRHRLDLSRQPRHRNCQMCWFAWFQNHGEIVQQLDEMHVAEGDGLIVQLQGVKFLHRWRQFMATIAQWELAQKAADNNEQSIS